MKDIYRRLYKFNTYKINGEKRRIMSGNYDMTLESIDWRYTAMMLGLKYYFDFSNSEYDRITDYKMGLDSISYHRSDITEDRFLAFAESYFAQEMFHISAQRILEGEGEFSKEQIDLVNEKLTGNTVMKKIFSKNKFDGKNIEEILTLIQENRKLIVKETFRYKKNLYANYCNTNLLLKESQPHCRLSGYNLDEGRKSKSASYQFKSESFVSIDCIEMDFVPFAFTNTYEALFINNNWSFQELYKTNKEFNYKIEAERAANGGRCNSRHLLLKTIVEVSDFLDFDIEVIRKSRDNAYYETVLIRKKAIDILKSLRSVKPLLVSIKVTDKYYIDIQREALECILNEVCTDKLIELLLKSGGNYNITIDKLIEINYKIKGLVEERGENVMKAKIYQTKECAEKIVRKMLIDKSANKIKSYRQKLTSAIVAEDYGRFCDILLQLSSYSDVSITFAYDLFEDFEKNKDIAYTFVAALDVSTRDNSDGGAKEKEESK
jgi:CRISPR-associated protein Cst1